MANALSFADPRLQKPAGAVGTMPAPPPVAPPPVANALKPQASFASPPQRPQHRMIGAAVDGFQRGFDPKGWQAGQDKAKTDKSEALKQQITTLQNVRALPLDQRMQVLPQLAQSMGKQIPPELMQDAAIDQHLALLMGEAGMAPNVPDPMSAYEAAQIRLKEEEAARGPKASIYSTPNGLVEAAPGVDPKLVYETKPEEKPPWQGAVKGPDGNWVTDPNYIKGYREMHPPSASGSNGQRAPSGYRWSEDGAELEPIEGGPHDPLRSGVEIDPKIISLETQQSGKWMPIQNNFADIRANFDRISTLAKNKNSASDLGLIVSFTKMLDPGSVAREGEVQLTQQAAGLIDQASVWLPRLQSGKTLLPDNVRQMYVDAARSMFGSYEKTYQGLARDTQSRASQYGLSPDRIMLGYDAPAPMAKAASSPAMQLGIRAYAKESNLPAEAITEFLSNPSTPQEIAEFNEEFGEGQAEAILKAMQSGR